MSDVFTTVASGQPINNGGIVTKPTKVGSNENEQRSPDLNVYVPSGQMIDRLTNRFDDLGYYT